MSESDLRARALKLLSGREHSRAELRRKLSAATDTAALDALLDEFEANGWLSDERFAQAYVSANASRFGRYRLEAELRQRGVKDDVIAVAMDKLANNDEEGDEISRARAAWEKKYGRRPDLDPDPAKQARFLQSRGFAYDVIRKVLNGLDDE